MPVSPTPPDDLYFEIARAYQQAELEILAGIKARLEKGEALDDLDWQKARLSEVQQMRKQMVTQLAKVNSSMTSKINGAFGAAYKGGEWTALKDASEWLPGKPTAVSSATRVASVRAASNAMLGNTAGMMPKLLRTTEDAYAKVVNDTVLRVQAGSGSRREATGKALQQAFGQGLKTGPGGKMNLPDYITMAMRTGVANTSIQGHMDTLGSNGMDLVYIHPGPRHCELCDEWANKPLWRTTGPSGQQYVPSATEAKPYRVMVWGTLDDAKAAGWGHPNCRCNVGAFLPGATVLPKPRPPWDEDGYKAQQEQRAMERKIREWKLKNALATDPKEAAKSAAKVKEWQNAQLAHMKSHPELKRQYARESINGFYGPGKPFTGPVTPPKAPKPPKPPKPEPVDPFDDWTKNLLAGFPELPAGPVGKLLNPDLAQPIKSVALGDLYKNGWITHAKFLEGNKILVEGNKLSKGPTKASQVPSKPAPEAPTAPSATSKTSPAVSAPSGSWKGLEKPGAPVEPSFPKADVTKGIDAWLAKVKTKYEDFAKETNNPKSTLEQSNNWPYVQKALDGDLQAADYLYNNKYLNANLIDEIYKIVAKKTQPDPRDVDAYKTAMADYGNKLAQYKLDYAQWRTDNGVTSEARGFGSALRHSDYDGINWAQSNLPSAKHNTVGGEAAKLYSGSSYSAWNTALRGHKDVNSLPAGTYKTKTKNLDDAMGKIPQDLVVHRGTSLEEFGLGRLPPPPPTDLVGKTYVNHAYTSTSVGTKAAFGGQVKLEIMLREGSEALNVMPVSRYGTAEREILLARGTQFFVHSVVQEPGGGWRIRVETVPKGEDASLWTPLPN